MYIASSRAWVVILRVYILTGSIPLEQWDSGIKPLSLSPQVRMKVEFARANKSRFPERSSVQWMKLFVTVRLQNNNAFHPAQSKGVRRAPRILFKCPKSLLTPQWASNSNSSWRRMDPSQGKEANLRIPLRQRLSSWIFISKRYPRLILLNSELWLALEY